MPQNPAKHIPALDGWRGAAILLLLVGHFFPVPGINLGAVGVNFFFVLSGVLMARILFIDAVPIPTFYRRRFSRIFPAVFFFLVAIVAIYLALGLPVDWNEVLMAAVFVNNYVPGEPGRAVMPFGHIWSLCVEEHSYILLSIIAIAARARIVDAKKAVGAVVLLTIAIGIWYWSDYQGRYLETDRWIRSEVSSYGILVSAFLFLHFQKRAKAGGRPALPFIIYPALVGFGMVMYWWSIPVPVRTFIGVSAFALAVNSLDRAPRLIHWILSLRPLRQLGLWSFSIYIWQQPFYLYIHRTGMPKLVGLAYALMAGIASFYLLEKPARAYLNRKWTGSRVLATDSLSEELPTV